VEAVGLAAAAQRVEHPDREGLLDAAPHRARELELDV
jgi:hypothetical protein